MLGYTEDDIETLFQLYKVDFVGKKKIHRDMKALREAMQPEPIKKKPDPVVVYQPEPEPEPEPLLVRDANLRRALDKIAQSGKDIRRMTELRLNDNEIQERPPV